jgi:hypothetical protein
VPTDAASGTIFRAIVTHSILDAGVDITRNAVLVWYLTVAIAGMLIGLRFRAGALIAATLAAVALAFVLQARGHGLGWSSLWVALQSAILLQLGYLAGLSGTVLWRRLRR